METQPAIELTVDPPHTQPMPIYRPKIPKAQLERERFYQNKEWDGDLYFGEWVRVNWMFAEGDALESLRIIRMLDQILFLVGVTNDARRDYVDAALQFDTKTIFRVISTQIGALQGRVVQLVRQALKLHGHSLSDVGFKWDGEELFNGLTLDQLTEDILPYLKLCRSLDKTLCGAAIKLNTRSTLMTDYDIKTVQGCRDLAQMQILELETRIVKLLVSQKAKHDETEKKEEDTDGEEDSVCVLQ